MVNSNIVQMNVDRATEIFLQDHKPALMKNKPIAERSFTVKTYLSNLQQSKIAPKCNIKCKLEIKPNLGQCEDMSDVDGGKRSKLSSYFPRVAVTKNSSCNEHFLITALRNEGREVMKIVGDGNCLFRAFAQNVYNDQAKHCTVRNEIANCLDNLHFGGNDNELQPIETHNTTDVYISNKIGTIFKHEIDAAGGKNAYVSKIRSPVQFNDDKNTRLAKYGSNLEIMLFAHMIRKDVCVLQRTTSNVEAYM
jgi:hypothetical protein